MDNPFSTRRKGILLATATAVISGLAVFVNGYGVRAWAEVADATTYTTLKNLMAALLIGVVAGVLLRRDSVEKPSIPKSRRQRWMLASIAVLGGSVPFVLFFEGLAAATSAQAAFLHKTLIIWVGILALVFLRERIGWPQVAAIGLLVWGQIALLGLGQQVGFGRGELMILGATLMWSVEVIVAKKVLSEVCWSTVALARMVGGSLVLVLWVLIRGVSVQWTALTSTHFMWIVVTGIFLAAYVLSWFAALSRAPAVDVTAVLVAGALITAFLQTNVRGVAMPNPLGLTLISAGVALVVLISWRAEPHAR